MNWLETPTGSENIDCEDNDPLISPIALEECNGLDNNCDGLIDNDVQVGLLTCYLDRDGDGFGDASTEYESCSCTAGSVEFSGDCDDTSSMVSPIAVEVCNFTDDNCDGVADNQAIDPTVYYQDSDGDGYGTAVTLLSCPVLNAQGEEGPPQEYAVLTGDCDDASAAVNPGQSELCTHDIDENCDGHNVLGAIDYSTYWADADADGFGNSVTNWRSVSLRLAIFRSIQMPCPL